MFAFINIIVLENCRGRGKRGAVCYHYQKLSQLLIHRRLLLKCYGSGRVEDIRGWGTLELVETPEQEGDLVAYGNFCLRTLICQGCNNACSVAQFCPTLCNPMDCSPPDSSILGFPRQEYWSGLPFAPQRDLPNPGIKAMSPVLAGVVSLHHQGCNSKVPQIRWPNNRNVLAHSSGGWKAESELFGLFSPKGCEEDSVPFLSPSFVWFAGNLVFLGLQKKHPNPSLHLHITLALGTCLCPNFFFFKMTPVVFD